MSGYWASFCPAALPPWWCCPFASTSRCHCRVHALCKPVCVRCRDAHLYIILGPLRWAHRLESLPANVGRVKPSQCVMSCRTPRADISQHQRNTYRYQIAWRRVLPFFFDKSRWVCTVHNASERSMWTAIVKHHVCTPPHEIKNSLLYSFPRAASPQRPTPPCVDFKVCHDEGVCGGVRKRVSGASRRCGPECGALLAAALKLASPQHHDGDLAGTCRDRIM
jgi:hypothetical protein